MKKIFCIVLTACMLAALFTGCGKDAKGDTAYIKDKGTMVVGMTDFAPMDYKDENGAWIGFDADMAKAFAEYLGVKVEFQQITWGQKAVELETKAIDVVWNGMTLTDEVKGLMGTGVPYCRNAQVVVTKADLTGSCKSEADLSNLTFAVEDGSAGAEALDALNLTYTAVDTQEKALLEVASGSVNACVIDLLMAGAMIGEGTSYPDLAASLELTSEEYGVGFRKDSDLIEAFNTFWKQAYQDGTVTKTAETYGIAQNIIPQ